MPGQILRRNQGIKHNGWSFFLRSIVHSSLIILILLFDRILGLPFTLQAEPPRSASSIPTSVPAIKLADSSRLAWLLTGQRPYIFHRCLHFEFRVYFLASQSAGVMVREQHSGSNTISGLYPTVDCSFISHHSYCAN